ncbi:MAG: hypothetical protein K2J31_00180 [Alistipes sp.]|nr:hypothetical protein [Alistipes sp.]MDE6861150.1 hypothetical protein [Alistipes sp.]MDE7129247.1 hypothetical protein [Alistipes sp.]
MSETKKRTNDLPVNSDWARIEIIIRDLDTTAAGLAKMLELKHAENLYQIKKGNYHISRRLARIIHERYPQYSMSWLLLGD